MGEEADREAFTWYLKAAEKGNPKAILNAGVLLFHGKTAPRDPAAAKLWLERAVRAGQPEAQAILDLLFPGGETSNPR